MVFWPEEQYFRAGRAVKGTQKERPADAAPCEKE